MGPLVVLAVALAVLATGVALVAALHLHRRARRLNEAASRASARLAPLLEELQAEVAVTGLEVSQLQRRQAQGRDSAGR